jgi:heme exporter protein A
MLEAVHLSRRYGWRWALQDVDLSLARGRRLAILGANGSGKTTLLRILAGLLRPTEGKVQLDGAPISTSNRSRIGLLGHESLLYPALTLRENLEYFGKLFYLQRDVINARIERLSEILGLQKRVDDPIGVLSQGLLQRAAMARAMLHEPDLFLLDEPFAGLDAGAAARLENTLRGLSEEGQSGGGRRTLILTTHDVSRALSLSDEVIVLARGKVAIQAKVGETSSEELRRAVEAGGGG